MPCRETQFSNGFVRRGTASLFGARAPTRGCRQAPGASSQAGADLTSEVISRSGSTAALTTWVTSRCLLLSSSHRPGYNMPDSRVTEPHLSCLQSAPRSPPRHQQALAVMPARQPFDFRKIVSADTAARRSTCRERSRFDRRERGGSLNRRLPSEATGGRRQASKGAIVRGERAVIGREWLHGTGRASRAPEGVWRAG
jgi:hypothetical protein